MASDGVSHVKLLAIRKASHDVILKNGDFRDAVRFLTDRDRMKSVYGAAEVWARDAIEAVRNAADPNPWRDADDETIAAMLLEEIKAKRR